MAGHGGARPGAGRPPGGVTQLRRDMAQALLAGLALSVRDRHPGIKGDDRQLAMAAAAEIARQKVHAGQGDYVLALLAKVALDQLPRDAGEGDAGSVLGAALDRLPGGKSAIGAPVARLSADDGAQSDAGAVIEAVRPADPQSAGRVDQAIDGVTLPGQMPLGVDAGFGGGLVLEAQPGGAVEVDGARAAGPGAAPAPTPTPPRAAARGVIHPHGPNFEILNPQVAGDEDLADMDSREQVRGGLLTRTGAAA